MSRFLIPLITISCLVLLAGCGTDEYDVPLDEGGPPDTYSSRGDSYRPPSSTGSGGDVPLPTNTGGPPNIKFTPGGGLPENLQLRLDQAQKIYFKVDKVYTKLMTDKNDTGEMNSALAEQAIKDFQEVQKICSELEEAVEALGKNDPEIERVLRRYLTDIQHMTADSATKKHGIMMSK